MEKTPNGLPVVLHVHDEIVAEAADDSLLSLAVRIMSTPPDWADGFSITVEGFSGTRYTKSPFSDAVTVVAVNGQVS